MIVSSIVEVHIMETDCGMSIRYKIEEPKMANGADEKNKDVKDTNKLATMTMIFSNEH